MKTYLLFGIDGVDLEDARSRIERALGIRMELHDSDYLCGDYYRFGRFGEEHFTLQKSFDEVEQEWMDPACTDCGLLLYVNETDRAEFLCAALSSDAKLVWRKEL